MKRELNEEKMILQEKLAVQRTVLANVRTFLSFLRTSMYFLIAGLSVRSLLHLGENDPIHYLLYCVSGIIFVLGLVTYFRHLRRIRKSKDNISEYKRTFLYDEDDE